MNLPQSIVTRASVLCLWQQCWSSEISEHYFTGDTDRPCKYWGMQHTLCRLFCPWIKCSQATYYGLACQSVCTSCLWTSTLLVTFNQCKGRLFMFGPALSLDQAFLDDTSIDNCWPWHYDLYGSTWVMVFHRHVLFPNLLTCSDFWRKVTLLT